MAIIGTLSLAGQGSTLLGGQIPSWMFPRTHRFYEGYDESQARLPEGNNPEAKDLFAAGQDKELQKEFDEAIRLYEQALTKEPDFVKCLMAKGILHCVKGELAEGRSLFDKAAKRFPDSAYVLHLLARVEKQMGLVKKFRRHEQKARHNLDREHARESLSE